MKKKLWLMGICICVLVIIFAKSIYKQLNQDKESSPTGQETVFRDGNGMNAKEALRLLGFLGASEDKLKEALGFKGEPDQDETEDSYIKFSDCRVVLEILCNELQINKSDVTDKLSFDLLAGQDNQNMLKEEFLNLYESILAVLPKENAPVTEKTMFILGKTADSETDSEVTMVTDQGNFTYTDITSYESLYTKGILDIVNKSAGANLEETGGVQVPQNEYQPDEPMDGQTLVKDNQFHLENYIDCKIVALVSGTRLVYIKDILDGETVLHNVYITSGENSIVTAFLNDISRNFNTRYKLSKEIKGQIGDLVIQNKEIVKISIKPDKIGGKVLVANQDYIEIEGYGKVDLDDYYKIYKIYGELSMEVTNSILVGYEATDFVVADGKIVAALIKETIKAENIRVLIKTNNFEDIYHENVQLTADKDFTLTAGNVVKNYKAGKKITIKPDNKLLKEGRIRIETKSENGKIELLSVKRSGGTPAYRGIIEIASAKEGLILINELPIEEYLYAVIPSEMPSNYGLEALKVQAICARSYAYNQLFANGYGEFGAHVDDSVSYQVYNNIAENDDTILAVKDTYGKVIKFKDDVITAYYFSTSCGHTASLNEVWGGNTSAYYLSGRLQTTYDVVDGEAVYASAGSPDGSDLSSEGTFRDFILKPPMDTYDSQFAWYRWDVTISKEDIKKSIDKSLATRYYANPDLIQTLVGGKADDNPKYESKPVSTIGTVKDILVSKREKSGILSAVILVGSECTLKVQSEYNIRTLLAPLRAEVTRQDNSTASDLSMLPSAFFVMDKTDKKIIFHGGGYGHGVGMSQNGVKAMADSGKDYGEIIKHYYNGVDIGLIY
ncbi:MAG: SpoIID/LytB domain-containing protein [Anaerocolumna sp.]